MGQYLIDRAIYSYGSFSEHFCEVSSKLSWLKSLKYKAQRCKPRPLKVVECFVPFPFIMASFYSFRFLLLDFIAGFTMLIFHIPQGMAYGLLAGLQPINGLYASFFPPLVYSFFGTSRHLSMGTFSLMAILASAVVMREVPIPISNHNTTTGSHVTNEHFEMDKLQIALVTTLLAGIIQFVMGLCRFGFVINYISDSLIEGFTTAAAFHVLTSQLGKVLGYSIVRYSGVGELPYKLFLYAKGITNLHWITFGISCLCIILLLIFSELINPPFQKKFHVPFPIQFVMVVLATIVSYYVNISGNFSVKIVGPIPKGFPAVLVPNLTLVPRIIFDAFILAIVGSVMNSVLVKLYALKFSYKVDYNQEMIAYGLSNMLGSFFQCTISAGALARSSVVVQAGMKSQLASLISCLFMLFVLLFIGPVFQFVPTCILSAIIVTSLKGMIMQFANLPNLYRTSKYDFNIWLVTFLSTILLNVPLGLTCGFLLSLLTIIIRLQNPKTEILGQLPNTNIYGNIKKFSDTKEISLVKIFRFEAPIYFANAEFFKSQLYGETNINDVHFVKKSDKEHEKYKDPSNEDKNNNIVEMDQKIKYLILDFSGVNYVDFAAVRMLTNIYSELGKLGISILIASPNSRVRSMLQASGFANGEAKTIMFVSLHDAVLKTSGTR